MFAPLLESTPLHKSFLQALFSACSFYGIGVSSEQSSETDYNRQYNAEVAAKEAEDCPSS